MLTFYTALRIFRVSLPAPGPTARSTDRAVETGLCAVGPALVGHVALAGEAELAVVLLVVDHVHQVGEHLAAVAADQDVGAAWKGRKESSNCES